MVEYAKFDQVVRLSADQGPAALLAKYDIKSAFRLLLISPQDFELLGFRFGNLYYYDKALPMGASISCSLFETFATSLEYKTKISRGPILPYTISMTSFLRHLKVVKNAVLYLTSSNEFVLRLASHLHQKRRKGQHLSSLFWA